MQGRIGSMLKKPKVAKCLVATALCVGVATPFVLADDAIEVVSQPQDELQLVNEEQADTGLLNTDNNPVSLLVQQPENEDDSYHHHSGHRPHSWHHHHSGKQGDGQQNNQNQQGGGQTEQQDDQASDEPSQQELDLLEQEGGAQPDQQDGNQFDQGEGGYQGDIHGPERLTISYINEQGKEETTNGWEPLSYYLKQNGDRIVLDVNDGFYVLDDDFNVERDIHLSGNVTLVASADKLNEVVRTIKVQKDATLHLHALAEAKDATSENKKWQFSTVINEGTLEVNGADGDPYRFLEVNQNGSSLTINCGGIDVDAWDAVAVHEGATVNICGGYTPTMIIDKGADVHFSGGTVGRINTEEAIHVQGTPVIDRIDPIDGYLPQIICDGPFAEGCSIGVNRKNGHEQVENYGYHNGDVSEETYFHEVDGRWQTMPGLFYYDATGNGCVSPDCSNLAYGIEAGKFDGGWHALLDWDLPVDKPVEITGETNMLLGNAALHFNQGGVLHVAKGATLRLYVPLDWDGNPAFGQFVGEGAQTLIDNEGIVEVCGVALNDAKDAAIMNRAGGEVRMQQGLIADNGTGIAGEPGSTVRVSGGFITNNEHFGIFSSDVAVSGKPVVKDNGESNITLEKGKTIAVEGPLAEGSHIAFEYKGKDKDAITSGYGEHNGDADPSKFFFPKNNWQLATKGGEVVYDQSRYVDEFGKTHEVATGDHTDISDPSFEDKKGYTISDGWYMVKSSRDFENRLNTTGDVKLILCDGVTADFKKGIHVKSGKLTIYAQSTGEDMGKLIAVGHGSNAGIGGNKNEGAGTEIEIRGGKIEAEGGTTGAGIGGGYKGGCGTIRIYNGVIKAAGDDRYNHGSPGIGSGDRAKEGGLVEINGGDITATGGILGAGIGTGGEAKKGIDVVITGGVINADGDSGAGIGGGYYSDGGNITISGGTVTTQGSHDCAGIGGGDRHDGHVKISGGNVTASGSGGGAGIGGGKSGNGFVEISDGVVTAKGDKYGYNEDGFGIYYGAGAGIGGGQEGHCDVEITGGTVNATGGGFAAGIGSGYEGGTCLDYYQRANVTIYGGDVTATGGKNAAGIGGGYESCGYVEINGGKVNATGGIYGAGIGTGEGSSFGAIVTISDGDVTAKSGEKGAAIGGGNEVAGGDITITGGTVNATAVKGDGLPRSGGAGIGGGDEGDSGTIKITGGDVTAEAKGTGARAIGHGDWGSNNTIELADHLKVIGDKGNTKTGNDRKGALDEWHWLRVTDCE